MEKVLHFLKELPAWVILTPILAVLIVVIVSVELSEPILGYMTRTADGIGGALLLSLNARRSTPTVNAENVEKVDNTNGTLIADTKEEKL